MKTRPSCLLAIIYIITGCASEPRAPEAIYYFDPKNYESTIIELQKKIDQEPKNVDAIIALHDIKLDALKFHTQQANRAELTNDSQATLLHYQRAISLDPTDRFLIKKYESAKFRQEANADLIKAKKLYTDGSLKSALRTVNNILKTDSYHPDALRLAAEIKDELSQNRYMGPAVDLSFDKIDFPSAMRFLSDSYGFNVVFDESVKDSPVSLNIKQLPLFKAISILLSTSKNNVVLVDDSTLLIFSDTKSKNDQYSETIAETILLKSIPAKDIVALLKATLPANKVTVNETNNSITIIGTPDNIAIAKKLINSNDVSKGELFLDVEILEVNLSNSKSLGIDYGAYQISASSPSIPISDSILDSINNEGSIAIPGVSLSAFKQDVDARILANPKLRVLDREKAKIHIGERVPLRSSDILDTTGQTRTTFEYQDVGIKLNVESEIHNNDTVTINISLEVSSLGENIGTSDQQAFRIGTRNAETVMLVNNGDTAVLGGLIRDESRNTNTSIPGIDQLSFLGRAFRNRSDSASRSDILLTISPRILRANSEQSIVQSKPLSIRTAYKDIFGLKLRPTQPPKLEASKETTRDINDEKETSNKLTLTIEEPPKIRPEEQPHSTSTESKAGTPTYSLALSEVELTGELGVSSLVPLTGNVPKGQLRFELGFNPNILSFESIASLDRRMEVHQTQFDVGSGTLHIEATVSEEIAAGSELISLEFLPKRQGVSFMVIKNSSIETANQNLIKLDTESAKISIN